VSLIRKAVAFLTRFAIVIKYTELDSSTEAHKNPVKQPITNQRFSSNHLVFNGFCQGSHRTIACVIFSTSFSLFDQH
jgi:hypothetical protein